MNSLADIKIEIFADGAEKAGILELNRLALVRGFTTNPSLMRKAGVKNYKDYALELLDAVPDKPFSFEVISDDFAVMERQAREIASWGRHVYAKVPISDTRRKPTYELCRRLSHEGVALNITAITTLEQVSGAVAAVTGGASCFISVFAGRIADTGRDPVPAMAAAVELLRSAPNAKLLWASTRELLNIVHAQSAGCHVITVPNDILKKLDLIGKDLDDYSQETVETFFKDSKAAGLNI